MLPLLRPALQVSPSIRNLITCPADLALCPLYPYLVPPWPLVSPLSPLACVAGFEGRGPVVFAKSVFTVPLAATVP